MFLSLHPCIDIAEMIACSAFPYSSKLTMNECYDALKGMTDGISPGNDRFTTLFYQTFWNLVGETRVKSLTFSFYVNVNLQIHKHKVSSHSS